MPLTKLAALACVQHAECCRCSRCLKMSFSSYWNSDSSQSRSLTCHLCGTPVNYTHGRIGIQFCSLRLLGSGAALKASPFKLLSPFRFVFCPFTFILSSLFFLSLCLHRTEMFCSCKPAHAKFSFQAPYGDTKACTVGSSLRGNRWHGFALGDLGCGRFPCSGLSAALLHPCNYFFFNPSLAFHCASGQAREGSGRGLVCGFLL